MTFDRVNKTLFGLKKLNQLGSQKLKNAGKDSSFKVTKSTTKKPDMVNSLSKEDYSFYYENSVWDQYEDLVYALQRNRFDEAVKIFKTDGVALDEALRPVS